MRSFFEELKQIAEEEFGCTIINSSDSKTFEEIFGFGMSDINENAEIFLKEQISIENCGYKFHRWYNLAWMEKEIGEHVADQPPVIAFPEIVRDISLQNGELRL